MTSSPETPPTPSHVLQRLARNWIMVAAALTLGLVALVATFAGLLAPQDPSAQDLSRLSEGPTGEHWLGTDSLGRDLLSRLLHASRVSLLAALLAVGVASLLGIPLGLLSGYRGGWFDAVASRIADVFMSFPALILAIAIVAVLGPGLANAMVAVGVILSPSFFRVARAAAHDVRRETYIEAAVTIGCPGPRLLFRHVLPNAMSPLLVQASFAVGSAIVAEAGLSFLGLGVQVPQASWGSMINDGFSHLSKSSFQIFPPAVLMSTTILAFAVLGDGLRDALGSSSEAA